MRRLRMFEVGGLLLAIGVVFAAAGCGDDSGTNCPTGQMDCGGGVCVNLQDNEANCGMCGRACGTGQTCNMGTCSAPPCADPMLMCGTACINPSTDEDNCGTCGTACGAGETCVSGTCESASCESLGLTDCSGDCVDTDSDEANCGACGNACDAGQNCVSGECACPSGQQACGGACTNTQNDPDNCGTCGTTCDTAAGEACIRGACEAGGCSGPGLMDCGGTCTDTTNDPANCGSCGNACPAGQFCVGGACECGGDLTDCSGACVDTQSSNTNCGACGNACAAGEVCQAGACTDTCDPLTACPTGCADLQNDPTNCGMCGNAVPAGFICSGGVQTCPPGTQDCSGTCVALNDANNCGACGTVCAGTTPVCQFDMGTGTASCISGCPTGESRCGTSCVNLQADNANCGACGTSCGGGSACSAGACSCGTRTDCDPDPMVISCADLANDRNNCGACGTACAAGQACITAGGTTTCQVASPTGLRVECPAYTFPAGAGAVQCRAFLTYGGGVPDQDVTTAPETTWPSITNANCTGSAVCNTPNGPQMGTTGVAQGRFTPAGSMDAAAITSNVIATPTVRWQRGATTLSATPTLTTEPAMATGYRIDPENVTLPYLYSASGAGGTCGGLALIGGARSGLNVRFRLLRTFAGGGTSEVPASLWTVSSTGTPVLGGQTQCDGTALIQETDAPGGLSAPRDHTLTARIGMMDVATTTITVTNEGRDRLRVSPASQTAGRGVDTGRFQSFVDFGSLAFEITALGDRNNVGTTGCGTNPLSSAVIPNYPYYWNCDSPGIDSLFPWRSAGASTTVQPTAGLYNIAGSRVPSAGTGSLVATSYGVFRPSADHVDATWTLSQYFPYEMFASPSETTFTVQVSGRQALGCRYLNSPATLAVNSSTPASGASANQIQIAFSDSTFTAPSVGTACTQDAGNLAAGGCDRGGACVNSRCICVAGTCRVLDNASGADPNRTPQTSAITWTSSAPSFATVSNAGSSRGQINGVAPGTAGISATYTDSFGSVACTTRGSAATPSTTSFNVNVVPSMLCDLIVTTRPFSASANPTRLAVGGAGDTNRTGRSQGIQDGTVATTNPGGAAGTAGLARRRAYYGPHAAPQLTIPAGADDNGLGNDPRVLLPNVSGITQQFTAVGYFANNGLSANCASVDNNAGTMYAQDITSQVSWDVVGTAGSVDTPNVGGTALTTDAALSINAAGLGTVVGTSTADRIQAVRATINSGERFCTGNGSAAGARNTTNPCVAALGFEVCGAADTTAGSVVVTPWTAPAPATMNVSPYPVGVTNPARENTAPTTADADFYSTFIGDTAIRYYALQRFTGTCALAGGSNYRMDFSERATWSTTNSGIGTVDGGALTAVAAGTTSITGSLTFGTTTLADSLDFRVVGGVINGISSSPTAAVAEYLDAAGGSPLPGGGALRNEVWLAPTLTVTGGTVPTIALGGVGDNVQWRLQSGDANCLEQYIDAARPAPTGGGTWAPFATVGMAATGAGTNGWARFRAASTVTAAGCTVTLRPTCVSAGGQSCSPTMVTYGDTTFTVRRGSVSASNFFIQSPNLTCNDPPAASWTLARYRTTLAVANGMAADFYVCARTSFGAWLRYDLSDNPSNDNVDIDWGVPTNPPTGGAAGTLLLVDAAAPGDIASTGFVRFNSTSTAAGGNAVLLAANAGAGLSDTLDVFTDVDVAESLAFVSPNTGASASASCTMLPATAPGTGTIETCLTGGQEEWFRITATGAGIAAPIDVTSDNLLTLTEVTAGAGCPGGSLTFGGARGRIVSAGSPAGGAAGYCTSRITTALGGIAGANPTMATTDVAILTSPISMFSTSTGTISLTGAGAIGAVATASVQSTMTATVTINTSWWNVGTSDAAPDGLTSTNPFAANPWTSRYWTPGFQPFGIVTVAGSGDLVTPGTPEYSYLYAGPVPAAQTSSVVARIPNVSAPVTITANVSP